MSADANRRKGDAYRDDYAQQEGVTATGSGLLYQVIEAGEGASPGATDRVLVHYEGKLIDGSVFDSSYQRGQPIAFGLNQVISGWTEGVQLMQEGAKYEFVIPPELAYGERGAPGAIGPAETLIFTVELLKVG